ncbi:MAG: adenylate/guanylate cyclase domain-containing protein [bacterium]|nr:adenylate/guanylate cyclase domain-containing protein [bacterium]
MKQILSKLLFDSPANIEPQHRRAYLVTLIGAYIAWLVHAGWMASFFALNILPLFYFNIGSTIFFSFCIWLVRVRGRVLIVMIVAAVEVLAHMVLAVYLLGWDFGFQYFAMLVVGFICLGYFRNLFAPLSMATLSLIVFLGTYALIRQDLSPRVEVDDWIRQIFFVTNVVSVFGIMSIFAFIFNAAARNSESMLEKEYEKSEDLLLNILPRSVAARLKLGEEHIADTFAEATVLFSDMVGFTKLSSDRKPVEVVRILNAYFEVFDQLAERHGVEKIKTIGDAYMVVGGVPDRKHDHAPAMARMALDMLAASKKITEELDIDTGIRIGLCSGPVTAGIIGFKKFIYDVWGDTVNTASRMESTAPTNRIQIAASTHLLIKDEFSTKRRGRMKIKGKGVIPLYYLNEPDEAAREEALPDKKAQRAF